MEIAYSILEASAEGALRTHIMFKCNLNSRQLQLYLQFLVDKGLLKRERDPPSSKVDYRTTELGRKYMRTYDTLFELVGRRESANVGVSLIQGASPRML
jgi:predicted transcriptional regulator